MSDKTEEKTEPKAAPAPEPKPRGGKKKEEGVLLSGGMALDRAITAISKSTGIKPFDAPNTTIPHVSTGSSNIDMLIGGSLAADGKSALCPGFPRRRITEVYGPESSGKTTLLLSAIAALQKKGGSALFLDFEHHISKKYACDIGVQWNSPTFKVIQPRTMEEGLKMMYLAIMAGVDIVGVDSVAAMVPQDEMDKKFEDAAKIGAVAASFSRVLPRFGNWLDEFPLGPDKKRLPGHQGTAVVLLNQPRALIQTGGGHGDGENTAGGKALKFYATLRIRMSRFKSESVKRKDRMTGREVTVPYGNLTDVKIVKSKLDGKQNHRTTIFIRYGFGIDDYLSIIDAAATNKFLKKDGAWFDFNGERFQGRDQLRKFLITNPKAFEELKAKLLAHLIAGGIPINPDEEVDEDDLVATMNKEFGEDVEDTGMGGVEEEVVETDDTPDAE